MNIWDRSLITGRKEASEVLPLQKGEGRKELAMLKRGGGHNKFWGSFDTAARSFSHKGGGWGHNKFMAHNFPIL